MPPIEEPEELETETAEAEAEEPEPQVSEPKEHEGEVEVQVQQPSRKEKRANRVREFEERAKAAERERDELRSRLAQPPVQQQYQAPAQPQVNRHQQALNQVYDETERLHREFEIASQRPGFSEADRKPYEERSRRLDMQKQAIMADAAKPQLDMNRLVRDIQWKTFESEHYDVFGDPKIKAWAWGAYNQKVAEGHPETRELALETLDRARVRFGKAPRSGRGTTPDNATRQRLSGVSSRAAGAPMADPVVKMNKHDQRLARELYPNLSDKEAYQKWANGPGKRLVEKGLRK